MGDIFGAPLAMEGLLAFFLESTFLGLWIFGWDRLPKKLHLASIWLAATGTLLSAYFILAANAWMQHPVGYVYNPTKNRAELTNIVEVLTQKTALATFFHTIPSAAFKATLGEDRLNARLPYHVPFTFKCEAACWFNGNMKPMTRDHGDAFYRRWIIIHFRNSKPDNERVPGLFDEIISTELGKIAGWAIEGAKDLLANGLKLTKAHDDEIASWREEASSVASWLADHPSDSGVAPRTPGDEKHSYKRPILRSEAYKCYRTWSITVGRQPLSKTFWSMEMNRLGHTPTKSRGDFVFTTLWEMDRKTFEHLW